MKICVLSLSENISSRIFEQSRGKILNALEPWGIEDTLDFDNTHDFFLGLSSMLPEHDAVLLAVDRENFVRCKKKLLVALGVKAVNDPDLKRIIQTKGPDYLEREELDEQTLAPENALIFASEDGMFSGFCMESDEQSIIFIPMDLLRLGGLMRENIVPYLREMEDYLNGRVPAAPPVGAAPSAARKNHAVMEAGAPVSKSGRLSVSIPAGAAAAGMAQQAVPPVSPPRPSRIPVPPVPKMGDTMPVPPPNRPRVDTPAGRAVDSLLTGGLRTAFAATPTVTFIRENLSSVPYSEQSVIFTDFGYKRNNVNPRDYAARLAEGARAHSGAQLGACITNIFTSGKEGDDVFIYVAVADAKAAKVRRIFSEPDEQPGHLIAAAADVLFEMIAQYSGGSAPQKNAYPKSPVIQTREQELGEEEPEEPDDYDDTYDSGHKGLRVNKNLLLVVGVITAIIIVVCVVMGIYLKAFQTTTGASTANMALMEETMPVFRADALEDTFLETESTDEITTTLPPTSVATTREVTTTKPKNNSGDAGGVGPGESEDKPPVIIGGGGESDPSPPVTSMTGTFTITSYGYGHGVGMSQYGANEYAKAGWAYEKILKNYYAGTTIAQDPQAGQSGIPTADDIARVVQQEMGSGFEMEALKAQAVAAYTYARCHNNSISGMAYVSDISKVSDKVKNAVNAVYGQYIVYGGKPINAVFCAMSAGRTAASKTIWGGSYSYLTPAPSPGDTKQNRYKVAKEYTAKELAAILDESLGVTMSGDPSGWLKILEHDSAVSSGIGYVGKLRIQISSGQYTDVSGNYFREGIMGYSALRSPCFTVSYTK